MNKVYGESTLFVFYFRRSGTFLTNGAKPRGPKCLFYNLWNQNVNWKLFRGPLM